MLNPRVLREMPPKIEPYDGTADYDKHVEHIDTVLDYHGGALSSANFLSLPSNGQQ
jgi:hypothetical protein